MWRKAYFLCFSPGLTVEIYSFEFFLINHLLSFIVVFYTRENEEESQHFSPLFIIMFLTRVFYVILSFPFIYSSVFHASFFLFIYARKRTGHVYHIACFISMEGGLPNQDWSAPAQSNDGMLHADPRISGFRLKKTAPYFHFD